jgi:cell division protein FtsL
MCAWAKRTITFLALSLVLVTTACSSLQIQNPIVAKEADIRVDDSRWEKKWNISLGWYANVTYTLHNYGQANGQATIEIRGDYSGVLRTEVVVVPAQQTVVRTAQKLDMASNDGNVYALVAGQIKLN